MKRMKHFIFITLAIPIAIGIMYTSCMAKKPKDKDYKIFSGKVINNKENYFKIYGAKTSITMKRTKVLINNDGFFSMPIKATGYYMIEFENDECGVKVYLNKSNDLKAFYDIKNKLQDQSYSLFGKYEGKNAPANIYLVKKDMIEADMFSYFKREYRLPQKEYMAVYKKYKPRMKKLLKSLNVSSSFYKQELRSIHYEYTSMLYQFYDEYITKTFKSAINKIDLNNLSDYEGVLEYADILKDVLNIKTIMRQGEGDDRSRPFVYLDVIKEYITNEVMRNDFLNLEIVENEIFKNGNGLEFEEKDIYYKKIMSCITNDKYKENISRIYKSIVGTYTGKPAPKFVNFVNYEGGTSSLDDFKGKFVYIDVWATW
jgi:hypothetical protein